MSHGYVPHARRVVTSVTYGTGADPILTDADALVTRDPSPFIARLRPEAQILVTSDHLM